MRGLYCKGLVTDTGYHSNGGFLDEADCMKENRHRIGSVLVEALVAEPQCVIEIDLRVLKPRERHALVAAVLRCVDGLYRSEIRARVLEGPLAWVQSGVVARSDRASLVEEAGRPGVGVVGRAKVTSG